MKKSTTFLLVGVCAGGLVCGFGVRRLTAGTTTTTVSADANPPRAAARQQAPDASQPESRRSSRSRSRDQSAAVSIAHRKSSDTMEELLALKDDELYTRLAAWMTDASEPEIAAFWQAYGPRQGRSNDITDLVFLNWTRLDPRAAIAGSSSDQHAWWAWASHDPTAALAEALANSPDHSHHVAWGIGEFHPEWLRAHYHELSEKDASHALQGMEKWSDGQDPLAAMEFLKDIGRRIDRGTFQALVRKDPWAALDWLKENPSRNGGGLDYSVDGSMQLIIDTMSRERPDDLVRLAEQTPSGAAKLKIEAALFSSLLQTDPQAALEQAQQTKAPRIAAERFAAIGLETAKSNPDQAFARAKELFAACPDALQMYAMTENPGGGSSGSGITIPGVQEFFGKLMAQDPARTLDLTIGLKASRFGGGATNVLADQWIGRDLPGYNQWLSGQSDPAVRQQGTNLVMNHLRNNGDYAGAAEMGAAMTEIQGYDPLADTVGNWQRNDPEAATEWLESANLPAARKAKIQELLKQMQQSQGR